ncbi:MAG: PocR ligand-binding domain-containing protein [Anaerolineales bacterium]|jgi:excisionase family DNA binding protein
MSDLITTKQVQDILQVDRITVYRMVKDGRLNGVKVGNQWRFHTKDIERILTPDTQPEKPFAPSEILPLHCIQVIQEVFAEILDVGAVTTDVEGQPTSEISNSCDFCNLILDSPSGRQACTESWKKLAQTQKGDPEFYQCHAGFQYARGRIEYKGELISALIAGQFLTNDPKQEELEQRIDSLSKAHDIPREALKKAADSIRVLDKDHQEQIGKWLKKVSNTFEVITEERSELLGRLANIAEMSTFGS